MAVSSAFILGLRWHSQVYSALELRIESHEHVGSSC